MGLFTLRRHPLYFLVFIVATVALPIQVLAQQLYTAVEIATVPQGSSRVIRGVNDAGDVVGGARIASRQQAFAVRNRQLGVFPNLSGTDYSVAMGINELGEIVGSVNTGTAVRAFRSTGTSGGVDLGTLPGDTGSEASAINQAGVAAGVSSGPAAIRAVTWSRSGVISALPSIPGAQSSRALTINNAGETAGIATTASGPRAVAWTRGDGGNLGGLVLGGLAGDRASEASSINNSGQIVGSSEDANGIRHSVLWTRDTAVQDLGARAPGSFSRALGINDRGEVVGSSETNAGSRAFLWTAAAGIRDLNDLLTSRAGFVLTHAVAISARGVILAIGQDETTAGPGHAHDHYEYPMRLFVLVPQP
jgi:probable HAF family extracellular repeat protein